MQNLTSRTVLKLMALTYSSSCSMRKFSKALQNFALSKTKNAETPASEIPDTPQPGILKRATTIFSEPRVVKPTDPHIGDRGALESLLARYTPFLPTDTVIPAEQQIIAYAALKSFSEQQDWQSDIFKQLKTTTREARPGTTFEQFASRVLLNVMYRMATWQWLDDLAMPSRFPSTIDELRRFLDSCRKVWRTTTPFTRGALRHFGVLQKFRELHNLLFLLVQMDLPLLAGLHDYDIAESHLRVRAAHFRANSTAIINGGAYEKSMYLQDFRELEAALSTMQLHSLRVYRTSVASSHYRSLMDLKRTLAQHGHEKVFIPMKHNRVRIARVYRGSVKTVRRSSYSNTQPANRLIFHQGRRGSA